MGESLLGARLREARRGRGVAQVEAAAELGISRPTLIAVEQGRRQPTPRELTVMARIYGRQVHELVSDSPPVEAFSARFRLQEGSEEATRAAVDTLQRVADSVVELETLMGTQQTRSWPAVYDTRNLPLETAARRVADAERQRLGLGSGTVPRLRELLEDEYGIHTFSVDLPRRIAGLFSVAEPLGACIAFNRAHPQQRQRWTLAHELAHFLMHRNSAEVTPVSAGRNRDERLAEAFAAHFLMPDESLVGRFQKVRSSRGGDFTPVELLQMAAHYGVSVQAMAIRLEDARLVSVGWWDSLVARGLRVSEGVELHETNRMDADADLLSLGTQYLAVEAFLGGALSEGRLAKTLNVDRVSAREKVALLSGSSDVAPEGNIRSFALPFDDPRTI